MLCSVLYVDSIPKVDQTQTPPMPVGIKSAVLSQIPDQLIEPAVTEVSSRRYAPSTPAKRSGNRSCTSFSLPSLSQPSSTSSPPDPASLTAPPVSHTAAADRPLSPLLQRSHDHPTHQPRASHSRPQYSPPPRAPSAYRPRTTCADAPDAPQSLDVVFAAC
ncbi:uncharacterized protein K444DRAFT_19110 [Hyaloscypha bicolor E]|uniref:Uncharacterized protein n=1 Tax=Hyaloscypha bicolor E TaxID=1095630 RepID=A0A2J6TX89_9HELO|nr:uncharacterized protein K444DRAFT_19110 [Hyaloscypha bicolor E]PMD67642.1 hypothetical protein K444DRAFT_19110 [Hyaloscypha bicolor E]